METKTATTPATFVCALCGRSKPAPLFILLMNGREFRVHNIRKQPGLDCADRIKASAPKGMKVKIRASEELTKVRRERELAEFWKSRGLDPAKLFPKTETSASTHGAAEPR